jgi:tight adherence protein C
MIAGFTALSVILIVVYMLSRKKYKDFIKPLDKKQYPLKKILPIGLFLLDAVKYRFVSGYDRKLLSKIVEIHGLNYSQYYLRIHWANKIVFLFLGLVFITLTGIGARMDFGFAIFSVSLIVGIIYFTGKKLDEKIKKKRIKLRIDFPDFLNKLMLLINAGMTVPKAWEKIITGNKKESALYEELNMVLKDIGSGKPEQAAYEEFAKRCRVPEITRFISVILQNQKKGNSELVSVLRVFANECWELRKNTAKRLGEEASTKMLLPIMLMFFAILLIVITPAVLAMRGI